MNKPTIESVFHSFCLKYNDGRQYGKVLMNPFTKDGIIYATDYYAVIAVDKSDCDLKYTNSHEPTTLNVLEACPTLFDQSGLPAFRVLNINKESLEQYRTEKEYYYLGEDIGCKECKGNGEVKWSFTNSKGKDYYKTDDCPECNGDGLEQAKRKVFTGRLIMEARKNVAIENMLLQLKLFYRVIDLQEIVGGEIKYVVDEKNKCTIFKVGVFTILILMTYDANEIVLTVK